MRASLLFRFLCGAALAGSPAFARVVTVTTTDNMAPPTGQTSLLQALTSLQDGDEIRFNLPGSGPHFIATPPDGYPLITRHNVRIDGYTQPGSSPNSNPILAANNSRLQVVLDSRNGHSRLLDFAGDQPTDSTGYGATESAILGVLGATGFELRGVCLLGVPRTGADQGVEMYGVAFAKGASGQLSGCWIGIAPDGVTLAGPNAGVAGFRYQSRDENEQVTANLLINDLVVGVSRTSANAAADFNVLTGIPGIPIIVEGNGTRIAGNFLGVRPDGQHDANLALDPAFAGTSNGFIQIGRGGNNTVIGTDGDGVNDAQERNVVGGLLPTLYGGYGHSLEFYDPTPGTNIVIAGNYVGVAVDGKTAFTNGVPVLNAAGSQAVYRFGSNLDGRSDALEGNVVFNHSPDTLFNLGFFDALYPNGLNFFSELAPGGIVSARGNALVNNLPFPASPTRQDGGAPEGWLTNFYAGALVDATAGIRPVLMADSTLTSLRGTVPLARAEVYPITILDLYAADPNGIATGEALQYDELPFGFVQGRTYLGSLVVDGPQDKDPAAAAFEFDLAALVPPGTLLTVTANYASGAAGASSTVVLTSPFSDPLRLQGQTGELKFTSINRVAEGVRLEWTGGGTLQRSASPAGGWQDVPGATSPSTQPASGLTGFFRLRR